MVRICFLLAGIVFVLSCAKEPSPSTDDIIPTKQWDKTFGGNGDDYLYSVAVTTDGGFLLAGTSNSSTGGDKSDNPKGGRDYWVVKIDANGTKQWDKTFGGNGDDYLYSLSATTDGGFLLAGSSTSNVGGDKSASSKGDSDYWVVKIDASGTKQWDKTFGGNRADVLHSVITTADGNFLLAGDSYSDSNGDKSEGSKGSYDYWVLKINANGIKQWDKTLGGNDYEFLSSPPVATADGGFLIAGTSSSNISGDKSENAKGNNDYWVLKINTNGVKQWDKTLGGSDNDYLYSSILTPDGGFLLAGASSSNAGNDKSENSKGYRDYWIVKINASSVKQWDKTLGGAGDDIGSSIITSTDGGFLLTGNSPSKSSGDKSENSKGGFDYWSLKTNANGLKQWDKTLGGNSDDVLRSVIATSDGGFLLAGTSSSNIGGDKSENSKGNSDYWVIKIHK